MCFKELKKAYDRVNKEALWQVLRMYDMGGKLLIGIKSTFANNPACVRGKEDETVYLRNKSSVRQGCIMSL